MLLDVDQPHQCSHPVIKEELFHTSDHLHGLALDSLHQLHILLILGVQELDTVLQMKPYQNRAEQRGKINLLVILTLMQPRMWFLGCKCTGKHLDLSLRVCSQSVLCPVCACTQECLVLGAGPTLGLVLQGFCTCIPFQAFQGPFWMAFLPSSVLSAPHNLVVNLLMVPSIPCC